MEIMIDNSKLFFIVWRNKVLRNVIWDKVKEISNFRISLLEGDDAKLSYIRKYKDIHQVRWMVTYNHLGLIKSKLELNEYLSFDSDTFSYSIILKVTDEYTFNLLYSRYNDEFKNISDSLITTAIKYGNLSALKIFLQNYFHSTTTITTQNHLDHHQKLKLIDLSIISGRPETLKFILEFLENKQIELDNQVQVVVEDVQEEQEEQVKIKKSLIQKHFTEKDLLKNCFQSPCNQIKKMFDFLFFKENNKKLLKFDLNNLEYSKLDEKRRISFLRAFNLSNFKQLKFLLENHLVLFESFDFIKELNSFTIFTGEIKLNDILEFFKKSLFIIEKYYSNNSSSTTPATTTTTTTTGSNSNSDSSGSTQLSQNLQQSIEHIELLINNSNDLIKIDEILKESFKINLVIPKHSNSGIPKSTISTSKPSVSTSSVPSKNFFIGALRENRTTVPLPPTTTSKKTSKTTESEESSSSSSSSNDNNNNSISQTIIIKEDNNNDFENECNNNNNNNNNNNEKIIQERIIKRIIPIFMYNFFYPLIDFYQQPKIDITVNKFIIASNDLSLLEQANDLINKYSNGIGIYKKSSVTLKYIAFKEIMVKSLENADIKPLKILSEMYGSNHKDLNEYAGLLMLPDFQLFKNLSSPKDWDIQKNYLDELFSLKSKLLSLFPFRNLFIWISNRFNDYNNYNNTTTTDNSTTTTTTTTTDNSTTSSTPIIESYKEIKKLDLENENLFLNQMNYLKEKITKSQVNKEGISNGYKSSISGKAILSRNYYLLEYTLLNKDYFNIDPDISLLAVTNKNNNNQILYNILKLLIQHNIEINSTAISYAIEKNNLTFVKLLVENNVPILLDNLLKTIEENNVELFRYLISKIPNLNELEEIRNKKLKLQQQQQQQQQQQLTDGASSSWTPSTITNNPNNVISKNRRLASNNEFQTFLYTVCQNNKIYLEILRKEREVEFLNGFFGDPESLETSTYKDYIRLYSNKMNTLKMFRQIKFNQILIFLQENIDNLLVLKQHFKLVFEALEYNQIDFLITLLELFNSSNLFTNQFIKSNDFFEFLNQCSKGNHIQVLNHLWHVFNIKLDYSTQSGGIKHPLGQLSISYNFISKEVIELLYSWSIYSGITDASISNALYKLFLDSLYEQRFSLFKFINNHFYRYTIKSFPYYIVKIISTCRNSNFRSYYLSLSDHDESATTIAIEPLVNNSIINMFTIFSKYDFNHIRDYRIKESNIIVNDEYQNVIILPENEKDNISSSEEDYQNDNINNNDGYGNVIDYRNVIKTDNNNNNTVIINSKKKGIFSRFIQLFKKSK